jgi:hypothetical protein
MLHQESEQYRPTPLPRTTSIRQYEMDVVPFDGSTSNEHLAGWADSGTYTSGTHQHISQQKLLRHSVGRRASYVAGMRSSTAYATPPAAAAAAAGSSQPLVAGPTVPLPADSDVGSACGGYEFDVAPSNANNYHNAMLVQPPYTPPQDAVLTPVGEDFVHEVLAMNTMAMEHCYAAMGSATTTTPAQSMAAATEEPMKILREAFMRLDDASAQDLPGPLLDQLKATTLNNMGVVECNRGQPRQALSHFEAARQLEENNDIASPSVALNTCAAYNALRMYDKATAAALEAIDMLRALEAQRQRRHRISMATAAASEEGAELSESLLLEAAAAPQIAESQNAALWGAAWNNLAVAQINTARVGASKDTSEYTNTLTLFQNAMRATQELLGPQHPMSKAVVETFRSVRRALRNHGAFKQHRTLLRAPLPPVDPREQAYEEEQVEPMPGQTRHNALVKQRQQLTITFRGEVTGGQKLTERVDGTPYPGAAAEAYQSRSGAAGGHSNSARTRSKNRGQGKRAASLNKKNANTGALRGMPHSETLTRASVIYGNPHPLLYTPPPPPQRASSESAPPSLPGSARAPLPPPPPCDGDTGYGNNGGAERTGSSARHARPSPPPPPLPQHQPQPRQQQFRRPPQEQNASSLRSGVRSSQGSLLPLITQGKRNDYSATDDDEMNTTSGTTASSVFMHVPPPPPPRSESSTDATAAASAAARLQQSKMLLLASPSPAHARGPDQSSGYPAAGGGSSSSARRSDQRGAGPVERDALAPSTARTGGLDDGARGATAAAAEGSSSPTSHELFQGMWVTADAHYVHRGPRVFGRPVYYTISTTLDVDENGTPAAQQGGAPGSHSYHSSSYDECAVSTGRTVFSMLTYSDSSSEEGGDVDRGA